MTFQEFLTQNNNKYLDFDGYYGAQCVDLVQFWNKNLGNTQRFTGNAKDLANQTLNGFYQWILNTPTGVPLQGDIMVWGGSYNGGYGHTGICSGNANVNTFEAFEQNDPANSPSHLKTYNYNYILGWLHRPAQTYEQQVHDIVYSGIGDTQKVLAIQAFTPK